MKQCSRPCESCPLGLDSYDALRPGGLELTKKLLQKADLDVTSKVLDTACGSGMTALFIAEQYHCSVVGIDISHEKVASSRIKIKEKKLCDKVNVLLSAAEDLPFPDRSFDAILCECSFTLVDGKKAAEEMGRVLKPGGKVLITNIFIRKVIRNKAKRHTLTHCLAKAKPLCEQVDYLKRAGFPDVYTEDHSWVMEELVLRALKKFGWSKKASVKSSEIPSKQLCKSSTYGYAMIVGVKS